MYALDGRAGRTWKTLFNFTACTVLGEEALKKKRWARGGKEKRVCPDEERRPSRRWRKKACVSMSRKIHES